MAVEVRDPEAGEPARSCPQCLTTNLAWLLSQVNHAYASEMAAALEPLGLGARGYCVLSAAVGSELTQSQLANLIGLDKTTMVVTVDHLEHLGLAERRPSPTDRRARVIAVTKLGERTLAKAERIVEAVQVDVLGSLPDGDRKAFLDALGALVSGRLAEAVECSPPLRRREP
jgi:MarR family transcriptional regulator for hemolysin